MEIKYDTEADAVYIKFSKKNIKVKKSIPLEDEKESYMIILDFDKGKKLIGIDIMSARKSIDINNLKKVNFEEI